jgi:hypothetical protein
MKIIGFGFSKISGERFKKIDQKLEIKSNIEFKTIEEEKIDTFKDRDILRFDFEYSIDYDPKFAKIEFGGHILALMDEEDIKDILKKWKKKEIDNNLRIGLLNFVMLKGNLKSLQLEEDLGLPSHIPLPRLGMKSEEEK